MNAKKNISTSEVNRLLSIPKVIENSPKEYRLTFDNGNYAHVLVLVAVDDSCSDKFLLSIKRSKKYLVKINLHHCRKDDGQFLFRVDLSGTHMNPATIDDAVPEKFHSYTGILLKGAHVHYFVEGYDSSWALPFAETEFRQWVDMDDPEASLPLIINKFAEIINLQTKIIYDPNLPLCVTGLKIK
jgi:hypothetical protein